MAKAREKLYRHLFHQVGVHLVVDETVHLQDATFQTVAVLDDAINQCFHRLELF